MNVVHDEVRGILWHDLQQRTDGTSQQHLSVGNFEVLEIVSAKVAGATDRRSQSILTRLLHWGVRGAQNSRSPSSPSLENGSSWSITAHRGQLVVMVWWRRVPGSWYR